MDLSRRCSRPGPAVRGPFPRRGAAFALLPFVRLAAFSEDEGPQVYLVRELENRVTDEAVQQTYDQIDQIAEQTEEELPPLEDVRLQIVQQLQQQAVQGHQQDLASDVEIVFYGPDGEPVEASADETSSDDQ
ncbi:hypothetical protein [Citreimonas salinaria]|uniref:hypothetical protein n=1 Tax=Citreimonas salinaria TaxID=321339 RepID=UPI00115F7A80|nr:hypothetical protein [Citreimonas salinaria]